MTRGLEWSACGQTLALTFANCMIGDLLFLSKQEGLMLAELF